MMRTYIPNLHLQIERECRFCNPPEKERILCETENFYVMVSLGPIVEGYVLIVAKKHIGACLHIPKEYWAEFNALKNRVGEILTSVYGGCIFYEHGKVGTSLTMGKDHHHCLHCHLHCIPTNVKMNEIVSNELDGMAFNNLAEAYEFVTSHDIDRYLLIEDELTKIYMPDVKLRSQYLRYKLGVAVGRPDDWDWVKNQNWEVINETIKRLKPVFG